MKKYEYVKNDLLQKILTGMLREGDRLMTESEMIQVYQVSRITIQKALNELRKEGLIRRVAGNGTFVSMPPRSQIGTKQFIATIIPDSGKEMMKLIEGIDSILKDNGLHNLVYFSQGDPKTERNLCDTAIREGASGLIIFPTNEESNKDFFAMLIDQAFPVIFIDRAPKFMPCNMVAYNGFLGMSEMANYLIRNGHREIAVLCYPNIRITQERVSGIQYTLNKFNVPVQKDNFVFLNNSFLHLQDDRSEINSVIDELLAQETPPTVIMGINDIIAAAIIDHLKSRGLRVPEDISVTGYDNMDFGNTFLYSLTTIEQNFALLGSRAAYMMLDFLHTPNKEYTSKYLIPKLIERTSVKNMLLDQFD